MNITLYRSPLGTQRALVPYYRPISIIDEIDELAREFWGSWRPSFYRSTLLPHTDVYEEKGELVMQTELPGVKEDDLEVMLEGDILTVKAEKKKEVAENASHHARERYYGKYVRSMSLPYNVDGEKVSATFKDGVLELRIPKAEEAKAKRIEVKAQLPKGKSKRTKKSK